MLERDDIQACVRQLLREATATEREFLLNLWDLAIDAFTEEKYHECD